MSGGTLPFPPMTSWCMQGNLHVTSPFENWDITISIVTRLQNVHPRNCGLISGRGRIFRLALGPTQPLFQWVPRDLS